MAKLTHVEKDHIINNLNAELAALRSENSRLRAQLDARSTTSDVSPRRAAMLAARQAAMESGVTTKVAL